MFGSLKDKLKGWIDKVKGSGEEEEIKVKKVKIFGGIFPKANPKKIQKAINYVKKDCGL